MSLLPRILLLDESADDRELVSLILRGAFGEVDIEEVRDAAALARAVSAGRFGAVLTEYALSWIESRDLLRLIRDLRPECPVLVVTDQPIAEIATELLHLSPDGLIPKTSTGWVGLPRALRLALYSSRRRAGVEPGARRLLDGLPVGVFVASADGTVLDSNPAFASLLGYPSPEECAYRPLADLFVSRGDAEDLLARLGPDRVEALDVRLRRADGGTTRAWLQAWRVAAVKGEIDHIEGLLTERAGGGELAPSGRTWAGGAVGGEAEEMAYTVSHDLRQPLNQVIRLLQLLEEETGAELRDDAGALLDHARESAERLDGMIEAVLRCARIESATAAFTAVDLDAALERVLERVEPQRAASGAKIERGSLPVVRGDEFQLEQLLQNLIENALKFRSKQPPKIQVDAVEEEGHWHLRVRDNGIGIPPADTERVFQLFQRLHTTDEVPGSGIGLAVCRRIVARHGGRIWVEPNKGGGSRFHATLAKRVDEPARRSKGEDDGN
ncbi:MAG TPA: ATP-binding protein [Thermoanaerobaculia bacterium]|nr:ATP-binding protein [Thermoanaerobaculia bacterium]